jgi:hypothetical protein
MPRHFLPERPPARPSTIDASQIGLPGPAPQ